MAHVRTFEIDKNVIGIDTPTFGINGIAFRETLAIMINEFEQELGLPHKTCQCFPMFKFRTGGAVSYETPFFGGNCSKVIVILTF